MKRNAIRQVKTEAKQKAENPDGLVKYEAGKFLLDTSKLVFAGVILGGLMKESIESYLLFVIGFAVIFIGCFYGFLLIYKSKKKL